MADIVTSGGISQPGPPGPPGPSGDSGSLLGVQIDAGASNPPADSCLWFNAMTGKWQAIRMDVGTF